MNSTQFLWTYIGFLNLCLGTWVLYLLLPKGIRKAYCGAGRKRFKKPLRNRGNATIKKSSKNNVSAFAPPPPISSFRRKEEKRNPVEDDGSLTGRFVNVSLPNYNNNSKASPPEPSVPPSPGRSSLLQDSVLQSTQRVRQRRQNYRGQQMLEKETLNRSRSVSPGVSRRRSSPNKYQNIVSSSSRNASPAAITTRDTLESQAQSDRMRNMLVSQLQNKERRYYDEPPSPPRRKLYSTIDRDDPFRVDVDLNDSHDYDLRKTRIRPPTPPTPPEAWSPSNQRRNRASPPSEATTNTDSSFTPSPMHPSASHRVPDPSILHETLQRLQARGVRLVAHGNVCEPKRVWLRFTDQSLQWQSETPRQVLNAAGTESSIVLVRGAVHTIPIQTVLYIDAGKKTMAFRKQEDNVPSSTCFSLLTHNGSLDLQTNSKLERDALVSCLCLILDEVHGDAWRRLYEESSAGGMDTSGVEDFAEKIRKNIDHRASPRTPRRTPTPTSRQPVVPSPAATAASRSPQQPSPGGFSGVQSGTSKPSSSYFSTPRRTPTPTSRQPVVPSPAATVASRSPQPRSPGGFSGVQSGTSMPSSSYLSMQEI